MNLTRPTIVLASLAAVLMLACGPEGGRPETSTAAPEVATTETSTGGSVRVPKGYQPPNDRVPSTGATIPVNGKPTLVYVDAIW
ncbi:MAG: hypothetical protein FJ037_02030 [Chloroflexi bacterium]|nr:hypothetical protein [Chloroflexota bacterium]